MVFWTLWLLKNKATEEAMSLCDFNMKKNEKKSEVIIDN